MNTHFPDDDGQRLVSTTLHVKQDALDGNSRLTGFNTRFIPSRMNE